MQDCLILLVLFGIVVTSDLIPLSRQKEWHYLYFCVPVSLAALVLNLLAAFNFQYTSLASVIRSLLSNFVK